MAEPRAGRAPSLLRFDDPAIPTTERDSAATAIVAAGLPELAQVGPEDHRARYRDFAEVTVEALTARHLMASVVLADGPAGCADGATDTRGQPLAVR